MDFERTEGTSLGALTISPEQIRANRYELLSRIADGLAHEVKNPIHAAVINIELLRRRAGGPDQEFVQDRIDLLEGEVGAVHELIDAFFRFLRPATEGVGVVDLEEVLDGILPMIRALCRIARVELVYEAAGGALTLIGIESAQQIFLDLTLNAVEAMRPAGGRLSIRQRVVGGEIHFEVGHTGPEAQTTPPPSTRGAGSHTHLEGVRRDPGICRHLVEEVGGRIEMVEPDDGTRDARLLLVLNRAATP